MKIEKAKGEGKSTDTYSQYLTFFLGNELYGFEVGNIREVIEYSQITSITRIPRVPGFIRGVINLRGEVMPVVDLSYRFFRHGSNISRRTCLVIVEMTDEGDVIHIGTMIDAVDSVCNISSGDIEPPMGFSAQIRSGFIHGIGKLGDNFIIMLNLQTVLDINEISNFKEYEEAESRLYLSTGTSS